MRTDQYKFVHPFLTVYILAADVGAVVGVVCLIFFGRYSGLLLIATTVLFICSTRRSTGRRYVVDFDSYRACKYPWFSSYVLWHRGAIEWVRILATLLTVAVVWLDYQDATTRLINGAWMTAPS